MSPGSDQPSSSTEVVVNTVFGLSATAISGLTIYQGHRMWKLWKQNRPSQPHGAHSQHSDARWDLADTRTFIDLEIGHVSTSNFSGAQGAPHEDLGVVRHPGETLTGPTQNGESRLRTLHGDGSANIVPSNETGIVASRQNAEDVTTARHSHEDCTSPDEGD